MCINKAADVQYSVFRRASRVDLRKMSHSKLKKEGSGPEEGLCPKRPRIQPIMVQVGPRDAPTNTASSDPNSSILQQILG